MSSRRVALVTLGCARNDVDSEELAARLGAGGFELVDDAATADAVVVNTCGFVEAAKQESINALLEAASYKESGQAQAVVAVGCLAERYGQDLAAALPEADAVLGFDSYADLAARLDDVMHGRAVPSHIPGDRRKLLPVSPVERRRTIGADLPPGLAPASGPQPLRRRLTGGPVAPVKLASGCDRRCSFCAIPSFRGAFVSRDPQDVLAEVEWLVRDGVREVHLVSENSTSYGKDLGDVRLLEKLLPQVAVVPGVIRVRLAYLQPAEMRPSLVETIAQTSGVADYFDLSFQHASALVLRRMRRFGDRERFLELIASVRRFAPEAGIRSNVIVGFPGEKAADATELERFLAEARLDAVGVFTYSDEDGTEAATFDGKVRRDVMARRFERVRSLAEEIAAQRAEDRVGSAVRILVESVVDGVAEGRAEHQGPDDGSVTVADTGLSVGDVVDAIVVATDGIDLEAEIVVGSSATRAVAAAER